VNVVIALWDRKQKGQVGHLASNYITPIQELLNFSIQHFLYFRIVTAFVAAQARPGL
jgi:hypothetical protein